MNLPKISLLLYSISTKCDGNPYPGFGPFRPGRFL